MKPFGSGSLLANLPSLALPSQMPGMTTVGSHRTLQAVAAVHPIPAMDLKIQYVENQEWAADLLHRCLEVSQPQLHTLALSLDSSTVETMLEILERALEAGQFPKLKTVVAKFTKDGFNVDPAEWGPSLLRLLHAGYRVHLIWSDWDDRYAAAFKEVQAAATDPDMLLMGIWVEAHGVRCLTHLSRLCAACEDRPGIQLLCLVLIGPRLLMALSRRAL